MTLARPYSDAEVRRINLVEFLAEDHPEVEPPPEAAVLSWSEQQLRDYFARGGEADSDADARPAAAAKAAAEAPASAKPAVPRLTYEQAAARWPPPASSSDLFKTWFPGLERSGTSAASAAANAAAAGAAPAAPPRLRLLCFSNAGSAEDMYTSEGVGARRAPSPLLTWARAAGVEVLASQLPGRNARLREPFLRSPQAVAAALLPLLAARLVEAPYAVLAHSVGTWNAFEFLSLAREQGLPPPVHCVLSAFPAPDLPPQQRPWTPNAGLSEANFKEECRAWDINEMVFSPAMWGTYQPILRADFALFDTYVCGRAAEPPLECPVTAFWAARDRKVTEPMVAAWRARTSGPFSLLRHKGNHLFPLEPAGKQAWLEAAVEALRPHVA